MRPTRLSLLLATSLFLVAPASAIQAPTLAPAAPTQLPGLPQAADESLWCATMASHLAEAALEAGDTQTFNQLAPLAVALSRRISTLFVTLRVDQPEIDGFVDLYAGEIERVLEGISPERYAPNECKDLVHPGLVA